MLETEFNGCALMVKEEDGTYRPARGEEIVEAAKETLSGRFQRGETLSTSLDTRDYLWLQMAGYEQEVFGILWLDNRHRVIAFEELFKGTIDGTTVHPREVVKSALRHNAAACILCHNHPSGFTEPSRNDKSITRRVRDALALVEVRTLDHFVVGESTYSFAEHGLM